MGRKKTVLPTYDFIVWRRSDAGFLPKVLDATGLERLP